MLRRTFFRKLLSSLGVTVAAPAATASASSPVVIQESPIAGFQFHEGETVWRSLKEGDELLLSREADNAHDPKAVAIYAGQAQLGYVPRGDNNTIAQMMDRGEHLRARICRLTEDQDPWKRVSVTIELS